MSSAAPAERGRHLDHALAQRVALGHDFYFVQIGAFDGRHDDPLYGWVQAYGWRGLLVEPQLRYFAELKENYKGVDGLEFRQIAVSDRWETRTLYTVADAPEAPYWAGVLSSFDLETLRSFRGLLPDFDALVRRQEVECVPLNDLLAEAQTDHIDLLQIDVEGYDHVLIATLDIERFAPSVVHFEHHLLTPRQHEACIKRLIAHGYRVCLEEMDTLAYRPADLPHGPPLAGLDGPPRLQAQHDAEIAAIQEGHRQQIAELEARLAAANAWTEQVARDLADLRERTLAGQHAALTAQIEQATERAERAERRVAELEGDGQPPEPGQDP